MCVCPCVCISCKPAQSWKRDKWAIAGFQSGPVGWCSAGPLKIQTSSEGRLPVPATVLPTSRTAASSMWKTCCPCQRPKRQRSPCVRPGLCTYAVRLPGSLMMHLLQRDTVTPLHQAKSQGVWESHMSGGSESDVVALCVWGTLLQPNHRTRIATASPVTQCPALYQRASFFVSVQFPADSCDCGKRFRTAQSFISDNFAGTYGLALLRTDLGSDRRMASQVTITTVWGGMGLEESL